MSTIYEAMGPGGHETYATSIFSKIKTYLDSNPYGYLPLAGGTMTGNLTAPKFIGALQGNATSATTASKLGSSNVGSATKPIYLNGGTATACTYTLGKSVPSDAVFTDTKNTAGSTDTSSKIFLIGATSQAANPQTYSQDTAYVGTDGCLYSGGTKVLTAHQDISGKADKSATVSTVAWSNNKLTKTINGTTSDVVSAATILANLTSSQVTTALGFTPTANTGTITSVKTTAGTHTTINVSSGAANFNVPTKTSHLTNDSGFVTTDAKVTQTATDGSSNAEYEVLFSGTADNTTRTEGARKTSLFTFNPQTNQVTAGHFTAESSSPSGNETASLVGYDVQLGGTSNTWDGTNTSLKQSLAAIGSDTGWQTVTSSYCDIKVRKIGKVVELTIWSDKAIPKNQQLATLADAYKPVISVYPNRVYLRNSISTASDITLRIENNGTIYNTGNANIAGHWVVIHAMWTSYPLPS